jgi:esterase/lipase superfamily enzyme
MNREFHRWYSSRLGREMDLLVFGHAGLPVLVFPTSGGSFFEYEDRGMVGTLAPTIEAGNIRLYCVEAIDMESWYNRRVHPRQRVERHLAYESYLLDEVLPLIHSQEPDRPDKRIAVTGCSLGAFHAALLAFRHPWLVSRMIALSGKFENSTFVNGYSDTDIFLTNPLAFLPGLEDSHSLDALRAMNIVIVAGDADPHVKEDYELAHILGAKNIPHMLDIWEGWAHDWPYWQQMIRKHL